MNLSAGKLKKKDNKKKRKREREREKAEGKLRHIPIETCKARSMQKRELMSEIRGNPFWLAIAEEDPRSQASI